MLVRFSVENCLSFRDRVELSMIASAWSTPQVRIEFPPASASAFSEVEPPAPLMK